jgi:hypothetical protein
MLSLSIKLPTADFRRIWTTDEPNSPNLLVLTGVQLFTAHLTPERRAEAIERIQQGADIAPILGITAKQIELISISRLQFNLGTNTLRLDYESLTGSKSERVRFADEATGDAVFKAIRDQLGTGYRLLPLKRDPWTAAKLPLTVLLWTIVATVQLALGAEIIAYMAKVHAAGPQTVALGHEVLGTGEAYLPQSPLEVLGHFFLRNVTWQSIMWLGAAVSAGVVCWLIARLTQAPTCITLQRKL